MQPDDKYEFSEPTKIQSLVKNYSQFVSFPIYTWQEKSRTVEVRMSFPLVLTTSQFIRQVVLELISWVCAAGFFYLFIFVLFCSLF